DLVHAARVGDVPQTDGAVVAAADRAGAVGGDGDGVDRAGVAAQPGLAGDEVTGLGAVPDHHVVVVPAGHQHIARSTEGHGVHSGGVPVRDVHPPRGAWIGHVPGVDL